MTPQRQGFWPRLFAGANRRVGLIWRFCIAGTAATAVIYYLNQPIVRGLEVAPMIGLAFNLSYATLGAVIAINKPKHPIGWLLLGLALLSTVMGFASQYAVYGLVTVAPRQLIGARFMGWLQSWGESIYFPALIALPYLLFPDGKLPSPRWRPAIGIIALSVVLGTLNGVSNFGRINVYVRTPAVQLPMINPTGMLLPPWVSNLLGMGYFVGLAVVLISIFAPIARYRKAKDTERQQLKWFVYFTLILLLLIVTVAEMSGELGLGLILLIPPTAASIAIVQYHLYDIDLIINRTLVYGLITLILGLTYLASITILQSFFNRLAGQQSSAAIVASTLFIAALFQPLRRRVQSLIDRRFYRSKYNMDQTLAAFGASLRDGVDQETLSESLLEVIRETIQPKHLSLWLRDSQHSPGGIGSDRDRAR